jgi:hypothetical protein
MRTPVFFWTPRKSPANTRIRAPHRGEPDRDRRPVTPRAIVTVIARPVARKR